MDDSDKGSEGSVSGNEMGRAHELKLEIEALKLQLELEKLKSARVLQDATQAQSQTSGLASHDRIGSLGEERRGGEIEGITARRLRLAAPPVTAASAALRLGTRRKPEHPIAIYDGDEARLV
ncbi:hypothetical protein HPB50_028158 [Hyalomma asiaticum]|nr:hypothetical protein HPB50_028158 [Hyalomma asiaticum]